MEGCKEGGKGGVAMGAILLLPLAASRCARCTRSLHIGRMGCRRVAARA